MKQHRSSDRPKPSKAKAGAGQKSTAGSDARPARVRIIGGRYRGREIRYSGDRVTRPMQDATREALFNLVGGWIPGKIVIDLFAGTGAVGLEAISRGAIQALFIERHFPTARIIRDNIRMLGIDVPVEVINSDAIFWVRQALRDVEPLPPEPWAVFVCPPYQLLHERGVELTAAIAALLAAAPPESIFAVELDESFDPGRLPQPDQWRVRSYPPARICVLR